jgi:hypothetical protein
VWAPARWAARSEVALGHAGWAGHARHRMGRGRGARRSTMGAGHGGGKGDAPGPRGAGRGRPWGKSSWTEGGKGRALGTQGEGRWPGGLGWRAGLARRGREGWAFFLFSPIFFIFSSFFYFFLFSSFETWFSFNTNSTTLTILDRCTSKQHLIQK